MLDRTIYLKKKIISISGLRRVWIVSNLRLHWIHSITIVEGIFWDFIQSSPGDSSLCCYWRGNHFDNYWQSFSVDRTFLFIVGSVVCQKSHSNHCISVGASANLMVVILLRSAGEFNFMFAAAIAKKGWKNRIGSELFDTTKAETMASVETHFAVLSMEPFNSPWPQKYTLIAEQHSHRHLRFSFQQNSEPKPFFSFLIFEFTDIGVPVSSWPVLVLLETDRCKHFHHFVRRNEHLLCRRHGSSDVSFSACDVRPIWHYRIAFDVEIHQKCRFWSHFGGFYIDGNGNQQRFQKSKKIRATVGRQEGNRHCVRWCFDIFAHHIHIPLHMGHVGSVQFTEHCAECPITWRWPHHFRRFPRSILLAQNEHAGRRSRDVVVGLRLSNHGYGQSNNSGGQ